MATELAHAYVTIIPSLKGASKTIANELGGVNVSSTSKGWGKTIAGGIGGGLVTAGKIGVGAIASIGAAVGGLAVGGGISRALKLDQAEMKFEAMGINVESAMKSCNEAVTGTAYGLDAAATVASSLAASGVAAGDEMTNTLKGVAGMAAMSGRSMEDIGLIWGKVAAQGKVQGDELTQFAESGINATAALASHLGITQAEVRELVKSGEVDFQTFSAAMQATFGEAAQGANETFSGAMSNVNAALSRIGAKFASPALEGLRKVFVALIPAIDAVSKLLDPLVEKFTAFVTAVSDKAVAGIGAFTDKLAETGSIMEAFKAAASSLFEGSAIATGFNAISSAVDAFKSSMAEGVPVAGAFKTALQTFLGEIGVSLTPVIERVKSVFASLPAPVQNAVAKFKEFFSSINLGGAAALGGFVAILAKFGAPLTSLVTKVASFGPAIAGFFANIASYGGPLALLATKVNTFGSAVTLCGGGVKGLATVMGSGLKTALTGLLSPASLIVAGIAALAAAFIYMMSTNEGFRTTVMSLVSSIGSSLAPVIQTVAQTVSQLAATVLPVITQAISALMPTLAQIVMVVLQVVEALAPIIAQLLNALIPAIGQVIAVVTNVIVALLPAVTAGINVVISIVQALIPIVSSIISVVASVVSSVVSKVTMIVSVVGNVLAVVGGAISTAAGFLANILSVVVSVFGGIVGAVTNAISSAVSFVTSGFNKAFSIVSSVANAIGAAVGQLFSTVAGIFNNIVSTVQNAVSTAFSAAREAFNNIVTAVTDAVSNVLDKVREIPGNIKDVFAKAGSWLLDAGKNILQGLWDGIMGAKDWLVGKIKGIGDWIIENKGPKSYDLKMLIPNGQWIMQSLCTGIESGMPKLQGTLSGVTSQIEGWSAEMLPYQSVDAHVRTWSDARIVTSDEREAERMGRYEQALRQLGDRIEGMRVVMDSGELVGATAAKYDKAQGRRQLLAERGF